MSIHLVLADPYPALRDGIAHAFAGEADFRICASVGDGETALHKVREYQPDILVFDFALPKQDGLSVVREMQAAGLRTRPVLFTAAPASAIVDAVRCGVPGVVTKDMSLGLLVRCIREVNAGRKWLEKGVAAHALAYLLKREAGDQTLTTRLTPREMAVARMVCLGLPNKRIAIQLAISEGTAKLHLHRIYQKLHLRGRLELLNYMQKTGMA